MKADATTLAKLRLEELLAFLGFNVHAGVEETERGINLTVEIPDSGHVIGYRGENLHALQYLVNQMVHTQADEPIYVSIDISGYKKARAEQLAVEATQLAEAVKETGKDKIMKPMNPAERRLVHMALAEVDGVVTESIGEGPRRRVVIRKS